jgi:hypothetical protein
MQERRRECAPKIADIAHFDWLWRSLLEGAERSALIRRARGTWHSNGPSRMTASPSVRGGPLWIGLIAIARGPRGETFGEVAAGRHVSVVARARSYSGRIGLKATSRGGARLRCRVATRCAFEISARQARTNTDV